MENSIEVTSEDPCFKRLCLIKALLSLSQLLLRCAAEFIVDNLENASLFHHVLPSFVIGRLRCLRVWGLHLRHRCQRLQLLCKLWVHRAFAGSIR